MQYAPSENIWIQCAPFGAKQPFNPHTIIYHTMPNPMVVVTLGKTASFWHAHAVEKDIKKTYVTTAILQGCRVSEQQSNSFIESFPNLID